MRTSGVVCGRATRASVARLLAQPTRRESNVFRPPLKIEDLFDATKGNKFQSLNSATAGARFHEELPSGKAPFQLYSLATPNGQKVGILLEELGIDYDAHTINIMKGEQFSSGFVGMNPNSKIPAAIDKDGPDGTPVHLFESASIVLYLAEKYSKFIPQNPSHRVQVMNWIFWQMSTQGPISGNFGHFLVYAPDDQVAARTYGIARYGMEVQRICSVLEKHLVSRRYIVNDEYSIADMMIFPWFNQLRTGYIHKSSGVKASEFLSISKNFPRSVEWADEIMLRPAVQRGMSVCSFNNGSKPWLNQNSK